MTSLFSNTFPKSQTPHDVLQASASSASAIAHSLLWLLLQLSLLAAPSLYAAQLQWSTYFGDIDAVAVDFQGNAVACGTTGLSGDWFTNSIGPGLQGAALGAFVTKIGPNGGDPLWNTWLGGNVPASSYATPETEANAIATDAQGNILVTGYTSTSNWITQPWPKVNGFVLAKAGFVAKLSPNGVLLWATYIAADSYGWCIGTDPQGNVLAGGLTYTAGWTRGGFQTNLSSCRGFSDQTKPGGLPALVHLFGQRRDPARYYCR